MKVITWNCQGKNLQPQLDAIKTTQPDVDIVILQECRKADDISAKSFVWSDSESKKNRGVGVFAFGEYAIEYAGEPYLKDGVFLAVNVIRNGKMVLRILGIWSRPIGKDEKGRQYARATREGIEKFSDFLKFYPTIVAGDFNSHVRWDSKEGNHADDHRRVVSSLNHLGLISAYHAYKNCEQSDEKDATLFHTSNKSKPYHIDYIFVSDTICQGKNFKVNIGLGQDPDHWLRLSDHVPVMIDFSLE